MLIPLRWYMHGDLRILVYELDVFVAADGLYTLNVLDDDEYQHPTLLS